MTDFLKSIDGVKTYLGMIAYAAVKIAVVRGWIDASVESWAMPVIYAWTGIAVRSAMKKQENGAQPPKK